MKHSISTLLSAVLCLLAAYSHADTQVCTRGQDCPDSSGWQLGIALGGGARTNPLVDGDALPLIVLPDIAYYHEHFYFDNGELGTTLNLDRGHQLNLFVSPNREMANFSFWHTSNVLVPIIGLESQAPPSNNFSPQIDREPPRVSVNDIGTRQWAFDLGLRWRWRFSDSVLNTAVFRDVSGVYRAEHLRISFTTQWQFDNWTVYTSPQLMWQSSRLTDYYYGIRSPDLVSQGLAYSGKGGWQLGIQVMALKPISKHWQLLLRAGANHLHSGMTDSPLIDKHTVFTGFIGMAYRF